MASEEYAGLQKCVFYIQFCAIVTDLQQKAWYNPREFNNEKNECQKIRTTQEKKQNTKIR